MTFNKQSSNSSKSSSRNMFNHWLENNRKRFIHPPVFIEQSEDYFIIRFEGVVPELLCYISDGGAIEMRVNYMEIFWDIVTDFDVFEEFLPSGQYYCSECLPEFKKTFDSREKLWEEHSFEPLLEWCNEHFTSSHWLYLYGEQDASTWAWVRIENKTDLDKAIYAIPILQVD